MNGEFHFGVRRGRLSRRDEATRDQIAAKHGVTHVYTTIPGTGPQSWFSGPNLGAPFDDALAQRVADDLERHRGDT